MVFWKIMEPVLSVVIALVILSQIVIPAFFNNVPFFWLFRRNRRLLEQQKDRIRDLHEKDEIVDVMKEANNMEKKLKRKAGTLDV